MSPSHTDYQNLRQRPSRFTQLSILTLPSAGDTILGEGREAPRTLRGLLDRQRGVPRLPAHSPIPNVFRPPQQPASFVYDDGGRAAAGFKGKAGDCVCRAIALAT